MQDDQKASAHKVWLGESRPAFLAQLDADPSAAFEGFYRFAAKLLSVWPTGPLGKVAPDYRSDMVHDVILHCCESDFRVLRTYRSEGRPFAVWFCFVARNRIVDRLRANHRHDNAVHYGLTDEAVEKHRDPRPLQDHQLWATSVLEAVCRCLEKLGGPCRLLIEGAADGLRPRDLTLLMQWPPDWNKKASDDLRCCRRRFVRLLEAEGIELDGLLDERKSAARRETR